MRPKIHNVVVGLGGRDVKVDDFKGIFERALDGGEGLLPAGTFELIGVRE